MTKKVLFVLTNTEKYPNTDKPTGFYLPEAAHLWFPLHKDFDIVYATSTGQKAVMDPSSFEQFKEDPECIAFLNDPTVKSIMQGPTKTVKELKVADYEAVVFPGGYGPVYDVAIDKDILKFAADAWEAGKVVAGICHGSAVLVNIQLSDKSWLVKDKKLTGFTNAEEDVVGLRSVVPFLLEDLAIERVASFLKADKVFGECAVADGKLLSGQNPASGKKLGALLLDALEK